MSADDLEALLQETLLDLHGADEAGTQKNPESRPQAPARPSVDESSEEISACTVPSEPSPPPNTTEPSRAPIFDPLRLASRPKKKAVRPKNDDAQKLQDDIMKLLEESSIGFGREAMEPPTAAAPANVAFGDEGASTSGGSSSVSATVRGLMEASRAAAHKDANFSKRPPMPPGGRPRAPGSQPLASTSGLFGDGNLSSMLAAMTEGEGGGSEMVLESLMRNLLSKDVLYSPLQDIRDKYPPWLDSRRGNIPTDEFERFEAQYRAIIAVCDQYETAPDDFTRIVDLIQQMQAFGDPPSDIVEDVAGGVHDGLSGLLGGGTGPAQEDDLNFEMPDLPDLSHLAHLTPEQLQQQVQQCPIQ